MHKMIGSLTTGAAGAWFVALGELDVDPVWSLAKKAVVIVLGGLVAGITHHLEHIRKQSDGINTHRNDPG